MPAALTGFAKRLDPLRMVLQFRFGGEQVVTIKINPGRARAVDLIVKPGTLEKVRFGGDISRNCIHLAVDQILRVKGVRHLRHAVERDAFHFQEGE